MSKAEIESDLMLFNFSKYFPPITRTTLALYAGASGDHNAVHIDVDAAKAADFDDVFAQGMLVMAYMGRAITEAVPQDRLREFTARFLAITQLGAELSCVGKSGEPYEEGDERRVAIDLEMRDQNGQVKLMGRAVVALEEITI
jgi:acyl dehydratase